MAEAATVMVDVVVEVVMVVARTTIMEVVVQAEVELEMLVQPVAVLVHNFLASADLEGTQEVSVIQQGEVAEEHLGLVQSLPQGRAEGAEKGVDTVPCCPHCQSQASLLPQCSLHLQELSIAEELGDSIYG